MPSGDNIVSQPPLTIPMLDQTGRPSQAWSAWYRDLYKRTAEKDGNAIDDNDAKIEQNTADINANTALISANTASISANAADIAVNETNITNNAGDISDNADDIANLERRVLNQNRPSSYDASGTSYAIDDLVVYPSGNPQGIYAAREAIPAPAGVFDPTKWAEKSIKNNVDRERLLSQTATRTMHIQFTGTAVVGPVAPAQSFNVATFTRVSAGLYRGTVSQDTFFGENIFTKHNAVISYNFTPSGPLVTQQWNVEFQSTGGTGFDILVDDLSTTAGRLVRTSYDPVQPGDVAFITVLSDLSDGTLPPA